MKTLQLDIFGSNSRVDLKLTLKLKREYPKTYLITSINLSVRILQELRISLSSIFNDIFNFEHKSINTVNT